jgi:chemotaxis protein CheC
MPFNIIQTIAGAGIFNAAVGFSGLLGHQINVTPPVVKVVPILDIPKIVGGPENEVVGIYLRAEGELPCQVMLIIPYQKALDLVDLLMELPAGSTRQLGTLERSALGEVGNMTGTFFMNALANITGISTRPTPPVVLVDMIGAILDIIIATSGGVSEDVLLMQSDFYDGSRSVEMNFWVIPDASSLQALEKKAPFQHE